MQSKRKLRKQQQENLLARIPTGRLAGYRKLILYKLAEDGIVMTDTQLSTFFSSGYSSVADEILAALAIVVEEMERQEVEYRAKLDAFVNKAVEFSNVG